MTQYPAQLLMYVSIVSFRTPRGSWSLGLLALRYARMLPRYLADAAAKLIELTYWTAPAVAPVARIRYGESLRSRFSF